MKNIYSIKLASKIGNITSNLIFSKLSMYVILMETYFKTEFVISWLFSFKTWDIQYKNSNTSLNRRL